MAPEGGGVRQHQKPQLRLQLLSCAVLRDRPSWGEAHSVVSKARPQQAPGHPMLVPATLRS